MRTNKLIIILGALILLLLAACSKDETAGGEVSEEAKDNTNETGMPIVEDEIKLNFFAGKSPATADDWNDVMVFNEYEKMTNIDIEWEMVPHASLSEKRNLALASGNMPDAFHSAGMPVADILKYGQQGLFIPLNDLIDQYAPNLKKIMEENPDVKKALTFPDGNIYSFPQMAEPELLSYRIGPLPWINEEWLGTLGLDMPETTEDYYNYLKAVKEEDPNGNGEADEIPYGGTGIATLFSYLQGSFGVANMGTSNANIDLDPESGDLRFFPTTEGYKELLQYMNKLFNEGLIEQNIFSIESDQYHANASEGKYGSTVWYSPGEIFGEDIGEVLTGMPALEGPNGHNQFTTLMSPAFNIGAFVITSANENPAATVRWIDHFYGDEGMKLFFMGIEGETFEETEDGEFVFMDHITDNPDGLTYEQAQAEYLTFPGGGFPSVTSAKYFKGPAMSDKAVAAAETVKPDLVEEPWSAFIYTKEETDTLASVGTDIDKYVEEMRDKFISGDASFDEWDAYVKNIEQMGLEEYMGVKDSAYERYMNN
ncbi:ABC transporter substrate-binding protein [Virgibacillus profundi]|uniref:ABC transporter substrate-binding protein n=1 Tax=Virgibacillus profundi TaxID=2024555 RepID=A0A2A2IGM6_9BACI|nr:extracellular solute-binding protein [Virgibacillus profundi]PAV31151.1 ABC transporter substrate-binding protein [Virgibacillus profundi]PXY55334.1 ABC transporter substrate-binding protein [Virgibacillus profundi]